MYINIDHKNGLSAVSEALWCRGALCNEIIVKNVLLKNKDVLFNNEF